MRRIIVILTLATSTYSTAASLCQADEQTYFSCDLQGGNKTVSICGNIKNDPSKQKISAASWIQYRFGKAEKLELVYPKKKENSIQKFKGEYQNLDSALMYFLKFKIGKKDYALTHLKTNGVALFGVLVNFNGDVIETPCESPAEIPENAQGYNFFSIVTELSN